MQTNQIKKNLIKFKKYIEYDEKMEVLSVIYAPEDSPPFVFHKYIEIPKDLLLTVGDKFDIIEGKVKLREIPVPIKKSWWKL